MAPPQERRRRYHAFVSFRGPDVRDTFVSHLYDRLTSKGIYAFKDDRRLEIGKTIPLELVEAIKDSEIYVVVLSENYAFSSWCLDELLEILDRDGDRNAVVPVFYKVDPSDVRNIRGSFAEAFKALEMKFPEEKVRRWKEALSKVANICGWDSRNRDEAEFIGKIVRDISDKVNCTVSVDASDLCGMGTYVEEMLKLLSVESTAVRMVGIWGMGGVGKSTIARVVFDQLHQKFEACWFIADVGHKFKELGAVALRRELLCNILKEQDLTGWPFDKDSTIIRERLCHRKVLIVLDDVNKLEQLKVLANDPNWFGPGSRIIITTQDKGLLVTHGVTLVHEINGLETNVALQLFCRHAFKQNQPKDEYMELSHEFLHYAGGVPLALKVLGSSLYNRNVNEWQNMLDKLKKLPHGDIKDVLKVSYDGLDEIEKEVFLDVACFFNGMNKDNVRDVLEGCGFFPERAFSILMDKALLSILNNKLSMHALLRQMGQDIVRQECKEHGQQSRWWDPDEIYYSLTKDEGTEKVDGIFLDMSKSKEMNLSYKAFKKMKRLRLLRFCNSQCVGHATSCNVRLAGEGLHSLSDKLRYLHWDAFPAKKWPLNFCAEYLVELYLPHSNVELLWEGKQHLRSLKLVDLSHSALTRIPDLSEAQKLETLNLQDCKKLVDVSSIEYLCRLQDLNLSGCTNLRSLPSMEDLELLTTLNLSNCSNLEELHQLSRSTKYIYLAETAIQELPPSIEALSSLLVLDLKNCKRLENLQNISKLKSLRKFDIAGCLILLELLSENQNGEPLSTCSEDSSFYKSDSISIDGLSNEQNERNEGNEDNSLTGERQCHHVEEEGDDEGNEDSFEEGTLNVELKKRKRVYFVNEQHYSETRSSIEPEASKEFVDSIVDKYFSIKPDVSSEKISLCPPAQAGECVQSMNAVATIPSFKTTNDIKISSRLDCHARNVSAGCLLGGHSVIKRSEEAKSRGFVGNRAAFSHGQQVSREFVHEIFQNLQTLLDQGPEKVGQNMGALTSALQTLKKLSQEDGVSLEERGRLAKIEKKVSLVIGQLLSANCGKKEIESKIQIYHEQSAKYRHLVAAKEKADKELNCTTYEIQDIKSRIAKLQEQLASAEKRRNDATRNIDYLITELDPLNAEVQYLSDANLEAQKIMIEESELDAVRRMKDVKTLIANF